MATAHHRRVQRSTLLCVGGLALAAVGHQVFTMTMCWAAWDEGYAHPPLAIMAGWLDSSSFRKIYTAHIGVLIASMWWGLANVNGVLGKGRKAARYDRVFRGARLGSWLLLETVLCVVICLQLAVAPEIIRSAADDWRAVDSERTRTALMQLSGLVLFLFPSSGMALYLVGAMLEAQAASGEGDARRTPPSGDETETGTGGVP